MIRLVVGLVMALGLISGASADGGGNSNCAPPQAVWLKFCGTTYDYGRPGECPACPAALTPGQCAAECAQTCNQNVTLPPLDDFIGDLDLEPTPSLGHATDVLTAQGCRVRTRTTRRGKGVLLGAICPQPGPICE